MNSDETQSYVAIRDSNIARNNRFLESLFGVQTTLTSVNEDVPAIYPRNESDEVNPNKIISCALFDTLDSLNECIKSYPNRRTEIQRIHGFLNPGLVRNSPLICAGPMGCGKSVVCRYLLQRVQYYPVVDFKCSGFTSTQQLIVALWGKVKSTLLSHHSHQQNHQIHSKRKLHHGFESAISSISCPINFKSFVISLREIIDTFYSKKRESSFSSFSSSYEEGARNQNTALCIFLDGIDHLASLSGEPSICAKFLTLSTQQIGRIKVLATTRAYDLYAISPYGEIVKFGGYSETQLREILIQMMRVYVCQLQAVESSSSKDESTPLSQSVAAHVPAILLSHPILSAFSVVLDTAFPILIPVSKHPRELFQASVSILVFLYSLSLDASTINSNLWEQRPSGDDIIRCTYNILDRHSFNVVSKDLQPSVKRKGQGDARPTIGSSNNYNSNTEQPIHDIAGSATKSDGKLLTDGKPVAATSSAPRYHSEPLKLIDRNTLRPLGFSESLPRSAKLLLIAAFLASAHRKEEDLFVLTSAQRGRRKKPRMLGLGLAAATTAAGTSSSALPSSSTDKGDSAGEAGAVGGSSANSCNDGEPTPLVMHGVASSQSFTLERLMGIYSQLALSIDGSIHSQDDGRPTYSHRADIYCQQMITSSSGTRSAAAAKHSVTVISPSTVGRYYGDIQLYSNVATLVSKGILLAQTSMNLAKPSFVSTISKTVAQEVAKSLSFNLNEYLTFS